MPKVVINEDQTVAVEVRTGRHRNDSLFGLMADGNCAYANELDAREILAVDQSVKIAPFPLGKGEKVYRMVLAKIQEKTEAELSEVLATPLGKWRQWIVLKAGEGCNAPYDSYLRIAAQIKKGETVGWY